MSTAQLFSSQPEMLTRGYGCYLNDPLRRAIEEGDCVAIGALGSHLPVALDAQYALTSLTGASAVKTCVIRLIRAEWESRMYSRPIPTIETFCYEYARLMLPWSCCRGRTDRDFLIMLDELRAAMQNFYARSPAVLAYVARLPGFNQPRSLRSLIGMQIVRELKARAQNDENFDRNAFLASVPEDVREIIEKYMTPPSSL